MPVPASRAPSIRWLTVSSWPSVQAGRPHAGRVRCARPGRRPRRAPMRSAGGTGRRAVGHGAAGERGGGQAGISADCLAGARVDSAEATRVASSLPTVFDAFTTHRLVAVGIYLLQEKPRRPGCAAGCPTAARRSDDVVVELGSVTCGCAYALP